MSQRMHYEFKDFCTVCGGSGVVAGSMCVVPKMPSARHRLVEAQRERDALSLAHDINEGRTEEGRAIRAHLITMGWRQP